MIDFESILHTGQAPAGYCMVVWRGEDARLEPRPPFEAAVPIGEAIAEAARAEAPIHWKRLMLRAGIPRSDFPGRWTPERGPTCLGEFLAGFPGVSSYVLLYSRQTPLGPRIAELSLVEERRARVLKARLQAISRVFGEF